MRRALGSVLVPLAACGAASTPSTPPAATCEQAAAALELAQHGHLLSAASSDTRTTFYRAIAADVVAACSSSWAPDDRTCVASATTLAAVETCRGAMPTAHGLVLARLIERVDEVQTAARLRDETCACTSAGCAAQVDASFATWRTALARRYPREHDVPGPVLTELHASGACAGKLAAPSPDQTSGLTACDDLIAVELQAQACPGLPQESHDAIGQSIAQQRAAWPLLATASAEERAGVEQACHDAATALHGALVSLGCAMP